MNDLSPNVAADRPAMEPFGTPAPKLGFVRQEPLDTMLKLERLPPPVLSYAENGYATRRAQASNPNSNARRHQFIKMRLDLAELVLQSEEKVLLSGDAGVIDGLNEVYNFLLHTEHLRLLRES